MGPIFAAVAVDADQCFTLTLLDADKGYELQVTQEKITTLSSQLKVPELKTWAEETFIQGSKLFTCIIQVSKVLISIVSKLIQRRWCFRTRN